MTLTAITFALSCVVGFSSASAAQTTSKAIEISGPITKYPDFIKVKNSNDDTNYIIKTDDNNIQNAISKLHNGDQIFGRIEQTIQGDYILTAIHFVGLKKLLGLWNSASTVFDFKSFSELTYSDDAPYTRKNLVYLLAPDQGTGWKMFLSNQTDVMLGTLNMTDNETNIEIYDTESGAVTSRIHLKKIKTP